MIAELRLQAARPVALPRLLPLRGVRHLGRVEMVEGHVPAVAAGAAETPRAQDAGQSEVVVPLQRDYGTYVVSIEPMPTNALLMFCASVCIATTAAKATSARIKAYSTRPWPASS